MEVTHFKTLHLTGQQVAVIEAVQGDGARLLSASLKANGAPWVVPAGVSVGISYTLPDKTEGYYDQLSDGSPAATVTGDLVTVALAPVLTKQAGTAELMLVLRQGERQIATFPLQMRVQRAVGRVMGEDVPAQKDGFEGRLFYGGPGGVVTPLALGPGLEIRDGALQLKVVEEPGGGSGQDGNGLSATAANLLIEILRNGVYSADQSANITELAEVLGATEEEAPDVPVEPDEPDAPEVTLTSISATYNGGDVAVGTAVTDLTGIVVTAHYSDGSTETVTGYTLSGTIGEGENTVTVSYQGKTATFSVTGVADSGGDESHEGVSSINWFIATNDPNNGTIDSVGLREPDNGYVVTTDTAHTALNAKRNVLAFPLISGKTYSIQVSNADAANQQFFGLWVSTLNIEPVKGEVTAVTDTIIRNIVAWGVVPANGHNDYTYTAGDGEYLMINANAGNILTITAEVTA